MPSIIGGLDKLGARFTGTETPEEKIQLLQAAQEDFKRYLLYALSHLDSRNFSENGLSEIRDPIQSKFKDLDGNISQLELGAKHLLLQLQDAEGNITQLLATAQGLESRVSDAEGNISSLTQTAAGLQAKITDAEGNITQLQATAQGLQSQVSDAEGKISTLTQTADGLAARISTADGKITTLQATAEGLQARVANAEGSISTLTQTAEGLQGQISTADGKITQLLATAQGLEARISDAEGNITSISATARGLQTTINSLEGDYLDIKAAVDGITISGPGGTTFIDDSKIMVDTLYGGTIFMKPDYYGQLGAKFSLTGASSYNNTALEIAAGAVRVVGIGGDVFLQAASGAFLTLGDNAAGTTPICQLAGGALVLGSYSYGYSLPSSGVSGQVFFLLE